MFGPGGGFGRRGAFATEGSSTRGKWGSGIGYGSSVSGDIYNGAGSQVKTERGAKTTSETKRFGSFAKQTSSPAPMASTSVSGSGGGGAAGDEVERGTHLDEARIKVGIVESMCPEDERRRRVDGNDLHILEQRHPNLFMTDPGANAPRQMTEDDLVIKRHMRAAAGTDISQPELLRTPQWLSRTVDHLIANCLDKGPQGGGDLDDAWDDPRIQLYMTSKKGQLPHMMEDETSSALYNFVWDRFRMIRSDYNMQGFNGVVGLVSEACIVAHERMARWYILMANRMDRNPSATQRFNLKSIVETLKRLCEFYAIRVARGEIVNGLASPNEPEIMAYYLLTVLEQDSGAEVQRCVKDLHRGHRHQVLNSPEVQDSLRVVRAWRAGDFVVFFRALRQQRITHRCLLAQYVATMRHTAIQIIAAAFLDISLAEVARLLCFESAEETTQFVKAYGLLVDTKERVLFRAKMNGSYRKLLRRPGTIPAIPAPQGIIESKPWALASDVVVKGDGAAVAAKSHEVNPVPLTVVPGDEVKAPVAAVPMAVKVMNSKAKAPPPVTPVFSRGTFSSPKPWVFSPPKVPFSAGVTTAPKTPARRGALAVPTKPAVAVQTPPPPSPVRGQTAPAVTLPPVPAFLRAASAPVPRAPYVTWERAAQNTVVHGVPKQDVSVSESAPAPEIISHSIDQSRVLPITEEKKAPPTSSAVKTRPAPSMPKVKTAKQIWEAEMFSLRLLKAGKLVPSHVMDQLPLDGYVRRSALDGRKRLVLVLMRLGAAMTRRRIWSAWSVLLGNRNRAEQHSPERQKSFVRKEIIIGVPTRVTADSAVGSRRVASIKQSQPEYQTPRPLDLLTAVAPGLAKSQGGDMEEAFRAVGLMTLRVRDQRGDASKKVLLSPPHMFWKGVVVAPARSRGHVGGWLEAKFGGGSKASSGYLGELLSEGASPALHGGESMVVEEKGEVFCGGSATANLIHRSVRKVQMESPPMSKERIEPQWVHLCVQRVGFNASFPLQPSPELSRIMRAASVIIFAATPLDQDRFFCSPMQPKPDWSKAREDLRCLLRSGSAWNAPDVDTELSGVPVLVVISVKDSILKRWDQGGNSSQGSSRDSVLRDAAEGLGLREVSEMGFSVRGMIVGLHEFESRSMAAAAAGEGLVFAGEVEESCSENLAAGLADLAGQAPKQPLMATRSLQGMFETAIARATTDDRYADAVGLRLNVGEPTLVAVVEAANRAASHVCRLVERRVDAWPMPEFAIATKLDGQPGNVRGERRAEFSYVPGAARPLGVELSRSHSLDLDGVRFGGDAAAALRYKVEASGALPLDWASWQSWGSQRYNAAAAIAEAACLSDAPGDIVKVFSPDALAGQTDARVLGPEGAWARVEQLERYLGRRLESENLRHRLAEALATGTAIRGAPPAWRIIVRDALLRRVRSAGGCNGYPAVVHFVVASGEDRLARRGDVPGLLEAEDFRAPMVAPLLPTGAVISGQIQEAVVSRALTVLKSVGPLMADAPVSRKRLNASPGKGDRESRRCRVLESNNDISQDSRSRLLQESVAAMSREAEAMRASLEREASSAADDLALDEAFFASIGISLSGSGGRRSKVPFDRSLLLKKSVSDDSAKSSEAMDVAVARQESETEDNATTALGRYSGIGLEIQKAIEESKKEEEEIRRRIFNGDRMLTFDVNS